MSLPVPTNPAELSALWRRARRLVTRCLTSSDTGSTRMLPSKCAWTPIVRSSHYHQPHQRRAEVPSPTTPLPPPPQPRHRVTPRAPLPTATPKTPAWLANKRHQRHPRGPQPRVETTTPHTITATASTSPGASSTSTRGPHHPSSTKHHSNTTTSTTLTTSDTSSTLRQEWRGENPTTWSHPASPTASPSECHHRHQPPTHHRHQRHRPLTRQPHSPHKRHQPNSHRHHLHHPHQRQSPVNHLRPRNAGTKNKSIADNTPGQLSRTPPKAAPSTKSHETLTNHQGTRPPSHPRPSAQPATPSPAPTETPTTAASPTTDTPTTAATHQSRHPPTAPPTYAAP